MTNLNAAALPDSDSDSEPRSYIRFALVLHDRASVTGGSLPVPLAAPLCDPMQEKN